nr:MAG TPA: hypothetical protein [Caudoviricetes sp.]
MKTIKIFKDWDTGDERSSHAAKLLSAYAYEEGSTTME